MNPFKNDKPKKIITHVFSLLLLIGVQSEVFGQRLENLALNKPSRQSTTSYDGPARFANDGNLNGDGTISHTKSINGSWWEVDLGAEYNIEEVVIYNRTDSHTHRLGNFDIWVTKEPKGNITTRYVPFATEKKNLENVRKREYSKQGDGNSKGRYVRIELNYENNLHMAEVQVYGSVAGKIKIEDKRDVILYSYVILRNGTNDVQKKEKQVINGVSEGYNFSETADESHRKYDEMSITSKVSASLFVDVSLEISNKFGSEKIISNSETNSKDIKRSVTSTETLKKDVRANTDYYVFKKIVKKEIPIIYKLGGKTYSWLRVLDHPKLLTDIQFEYPNGSTPEVLKYLDDKTEHIISKEEFKKIESWFNEYKKRGSQPSTTIPEPITIQRPVTIPQAQETITIIEESNVTYTSCGHLSDGELRETLLSNNFEFEDFGGSFTECQTTDGDLIWTNDDGESWALRPDFQNARLISVDSNNPYNRENGGNTFKIVVEDDTITGIEFMSDFYYLYD